MATWYTVEEAQARWGVGAPSEERLAELLAVSKQQCIAYAPVPQADATAVFEATLNDTPLADIVPDGHREAHFVQARNVWNATKVAPSGVMGGDSFELTPHPLDWHVKQLLRPRTARPKVG